MKNIGQMMKQAQKLQQKMTELQEQMAAMEVDGVSGGGMVRVVLNGKGEARRVSIDRGLVSGPDDVEVLEDLMVAAINDAKAKVEATMQDKMKEMTGGLQLPPGMQFPF